MKTEIKQPKRRRGKSMSKRPVEVTCFICAKKMRKIDSVPLKMGAGFVHNSCLKQVAP